MAFTRECSRDWASRAACKNIGERVVRLERTDGSCLLRVEKAIPHLEASIGHGNDPSGRSSKKAFEAHEIGQQNKESRLQGFEAAEDSTKPFVRYVYNILEGV